MEKLVKEEVSYFISSEDYYKGMFMTAMLSLPKEYIASSENETGYGRSDYEIYKEDKSVGMVYEFKVCSELKDVEKVAATADTEAVTSKSRGNPSVTISLTTSSSTSSSLYGIADFQSSSVKAYVIPSS